MNIDIETIMGFVVEVLLAIVLILHPPHYKNCDEARRDYPFGLQAGDPGYSRNLDMDGDGFACEM